MRLFVYMMGLVGEFCWNHYIFSLLRALSIDGVILKEYVLIVFQSIVHGTRECGLL